MKKIILSCCLLLLVITASLAKTSINGLAVEYQQTPIGIDVKKPRFSWKMISDNGKFGIYQTAYQISVTDSRGKIMWDSNKVKKSESLHIVYDGIDLEPEMRYNWTLTVWDQNKKNIQKKSWFETGLMSPDISAWDGAEWIGGSSKDLVFYSDYQVIFGLKYTLAIREGSTSAAFIYGANDIRLMDRDKNTYGLENGKNKSYIKLELDISDVEKSSTGLVKLNIYRVGYTPSDKSDVPFKTFEILSSVINFENRNKSHKFDLMSAYGEIRIRIDNEDLFFKENKKNRRKSQPSFLNVKPGAVVNLNPYGNGGDYIPMGMICEMGFAMNPGQQALFSGLEIYNDRMPNSTLFKEDLQQAYSGIYADKVKVIDGAYLLDGGARGMFVVANPSKNSTPMLRTEFHAKKQIQSARLYVTARGIYELFINGKRVGNDYYNPGLTQYNKTHFYQTYDVTSMLKEGKNAIGAVMSEGWWSGLLGFVGPEQVWNHFGDRQSLLVKLVVRYNDGSEMTVTSNNKDWKYYNKGPIVYSSLFLGEVYDARKESKIQGWTKPGFNSLGWENASVISIKGTTFAGEDRDMQGRTVNLNYDHIELVGQIGNNAGIYKILSAKSVNEIRPGVFVYDMGQNFVGVPKITLKNGTEGDSLILRYSEMLYPDLEDSGKNVGMVMTENYRAALCQDIYIMKDGFQIFQPKFTSHGYRYIEITGINKALPLDAVKGVAISSVIDLTASYETSNKKVNQLWSNLVWSNVGNFLTLPTDCPQRNERMGWSGDISVFAKTSTYLSNTDQFLRRHLVAMRDLQHKDGKFTDIAPIGGGFGGVLWGSAGITVPWELYQQYNDIGVLDENYNAMVSYIDYLDKSIDSETGMCSDVQLGDWLGPQNNKLGAQYLATVYHVYDLWILKEVAGLLGEKSDAERFKKMYDERKSFFNKSFVREDGKTKGFGHGYIFGKQPGSETEFKLADTQTSYSVGLALNAFNKESIPQFAQNLADAIARENIDDNGKILPKYSLMTGFIGTASVCSALSENGYNEHAYRLLQSEHYPSWLYSVNQGATSIWERLNGYTIEKGFGGNNSMNSFNHYSFGAVGQWMVEYSLGIKRGKPGFQQFTICPKPDPSGQMTWAKGWYDSMYGRIESEWRVENDKTLYKFKIPANTSATLILQVGKNTSVRKMFSGKTKRMISKLIYDNGDDTYKLSSGTYFFEIKH